MRRYELCASRSPPTTPRNSAQPIEGRLPEDLSETDTALPPGVIIVEPKRFADPRGFLCELHHAERYAKAGIAEPFVQDNLSRSTHAVLRGLHLLHLP